ncbi:MAG: cobalamin-dependent protein [Euryarchaeota archaeon]|nr:cobalamin-dependent protein [Euryarchaeota archaeon]
MEVEGTAFECPIDQALERSGVSSRELTMSNEILEKLKKAIIEMDSDAATATALEIVSGEMDVTDAVINGLNAGMRTVAEQYDRKETYLPQVLASANTFYAAFDILRPHLTIDLERQGRRMVIGVVEGDIHDIGKNLIKVMIEAHGYNCIDLGRDVPTETFIKNIIESRPDYVAISTLMTPTLMGMREIIDTMIDNDIRKDVVILVGGGQVSQRFADDIGADFYGKGERDTVAWLKVREMKEVNK